MRWHIIRCIRIKKNFVAQNSVWKCILRLSFYYCYPVEEMTWNKPCLRNILPEKPYTKCGGETIPGAFFRKFKNWVYIWINSLKFYKDVFIVCQDEGYQNILKLSCSSLAFTSEYKAFYKDKKRLKCFHHQIWTSVKGSEKYQVRHVLALFLL